MHSLFRLFPCIAHFANTFFSVCLRCVVSVATGGHSCFSDGWTVSPAASDPSLSIEQRTSPLLHTCAAQSAEECQRLCQESDERCAAWEWNVLTEDCRLWDAHISLRRPNELPLGLSVYSSPSEQASIEIPDAQSREAALRRRLESMKTVVGPRVCPHALLAESRETNETASRASRCQIPTRAENMPSKHISHFPGCSW